MQVEFRKIADLLPYARNTRTHSDAQIDQLVRSIAEFGWTNPVMADETGLVAGHGRIHAARKIYGSGGIIKLPNGQEIPIGEVPVLDCTGWSDSKRRAYIIADNQLALNAGWDDSLLKLELDDLQADGFDLDILGFDSDDVDRLMASTEKKAGLTDDDDAPALQEKSTSKPGDIWILGCHRVMCGDSTNLDHVQSLSDGTLMDACWTDPPYNVNYEGGSGLKIQNDSMSDDKFYAFLYDAYVSMFSVMKPGAAIYVAHADTEGYNFRKAFREAGFKLSGCLIWVKNSLVLGRSDYQWRHEPILYGWKPGAAHKWYGARNKTTVLDSVAQPFINLGDGRFQIDIGKTSLIISGADINVEEVCSSIIHAEKPKRNGEHPTMKPVDLIVGMLKNSCRKGGTVLDLFGGSGSTLIACEKTGRHARLMELDERYCDVIVRRWQSFTGNQARLSGDGRTFDEIEKAALRKLNNVTQ